jgi:hypothetical protein
VIERKWVDLWINIIMDRFNTNLDALISGLRGLWAAKENEVMAGELDSYKMGRLKNAIEKIDSFEVAANEAKKNPDQYEIILKNFMATFNEIKKEIAEIS